MRSHLDPQGHLKFGGEGFPFAFNLIWAILVAPIDNVLKPILLGRGVDVPMLVIFVGAIGGFLSSGIIGLFLGAVVLAVGYKLFLTWLKQEDLTAGTTT